MNEALIARWNALVTPEDTVWHLGDFAVRLGAAAAAAILARLNGSKHLIAGNNDGPTIRALPGWASVQDYAELVVEGRRLVLCHYPLRAWRDSGRGAIDLHGHSHGRLTPWPRQIDVGVDAWNFEPVPIETILALTRRGRREARPDRA